MTTNQANDLMQKFVNNGFKCKVYFKDNTRPPVIGWFVKHSDSEALAEKKMARFLSLSKEMDYSYFEHESKKNEFTRIQNAETIFDIVKVNL